MKKECKFLLAVMWIFFMALAFLGCHNREEKPEKTPPATINPSLSTYDNNIAVVKSVDGYTEDDAKALMRVLEHLVEQGSVANDKMVSAEKYVDQLVDGQGKKHTDTYLRFVTEDGEIYYALILSHSDVYLIFRGPLEDRQYIWAIIE